jgi:sugar lactone lactonase YvrE
LGTFYRFTKDEQFVPLKSSVGISNGLAWNEKTNKFYYIDSVDLDVKEFDYDPVTGNLGMCSSFAFQQRQHEIFIQIFSPQQMSVLSSISLLTENVRISCQME